MMSYVKLKCWYVLVDWNNSTGNHVCFFSKWFCQPCVSDAQNPLLVLNMVIIPTAGRRKPSTGAGWHRQETEKPALYPDLLMPRPGLAPPHGRIPPNKQQANQWRCSWVERLRITWGLTQRVWSQREKRNSHDLQRTTSCSSSVQLCVGTTRTPATITCDRGSPVKVIVKTLRASIRRKLFGTANELVAKWNEIYRKGEGRLLASTVPGAVVQSTLVTVVMNGAA